VTEGRWSLRVWSVIRDEERVRCEQEKRAEIRRMTSFERFVSERENFVLNFLIYCKPKPVKRFENRSDMMKFWSMSDGTGSRIENMLETVNLSSRKYLKS
jgi:hypothetical protein